MELVEKSRIETGKTWGSHGARGQAALPSPSVPPFPPRAARAPSAASRCHVPIWRRRARGCPGIHGSYYFYFLEEKRRKN